MASVDEHLKILTQKMQMLVKNHQQLQKEMAAIKKEAEGQRLLLKEKTEAIQKLQEKLDAANMSSNASAMDAAEKKMLEQRINGYLAEIEKCLVLLNS
jgi:predicted  nucleic acid-binding Zn-ribbon protein